MKEKSEFRVEADSLGEVEIPTAAYWGIRTARANLGISGVAAQSRLTDALVILKRCALDLSPANGSKNRDVKEAILSSCSEILEGKLKANFIATPYQCDAGAALDTNVNEVIANRAEEILGGSLGSYARVNPYEDVDIWCGPLEVQLKNAAKIALLLEYKELEPAILDLERWFRRKSLECEQIIQSLDTGNGTKFWQSMMGPELNACGEVVERCHRRLLESAAWLQDINLTDESFSSEDTNGKHELKEKELIESIGKVLGITLRSTQEKGLQCKSMSEFLQLSSALKELAIELSAVCRNLSISCGKFNTSIGPAENKRNGNAKDNNEKHTLKRMTDLFALTACQVIANDYVLSQCCQLTEVPSSIPFTVNSLLQSLDLLRSALTHFNLRCATEFTP